MKLASSFFVLLCLLENFKNAACSSSSRVKGRLDPLFEEDDIETQGDPLAQYMKAAILDVNVREDGGVEKSPMMLERKARGPTLSGGSVFEESHPLNTRPGSFLNYRDDNEFESGTDFDAEGTFDFKPAGTSSGDMGSSSDSIGSQNTAKERQLVMPSAVAREKSKSPLPTRQTRSASNPVSKSRSTSPMPAFIKSFFRKSGGDEVSKSATTVIENNKKHTSNLMGKIKASSFTDSSTSEKEADDVNTSSESDLDLLPGSDREPITSMYSEGLLKSPIQHQRRDERPLSVNLNRNEKVEILKPRSASRASIKSFISRSKAAEDAIQLPLMINPEIFGPNEAYDDMFATALYKPDEVFEPISNYAFSMIAGFMPLSRAEPGKSLIGDGIQADSMKKDFTNLLTTLHGLTDHQGHDDFELDLVKESVTRMMGYILGKTSTQSVEDIDNLAIMPQRVLITPRDIFYYPGMLKASALFVSMFDSSRSNEFFYQFIHTFYSGVYGPKREDLYFITRMQLIPKAVISDRMLEISLNSEEMINSGYIRNEAFSDAEISLALFNIKSRREMFYDPTKRSYLSLLHGKVDTRYRELNPVPKTLDDVLDLSMGILLFDLRKNPKSWKGQIPDSEGLRSEIFSEVHIQAMQSLYLNVLYPLEVKDLVEHLVFNLGQGTYSRSYRNYMASFVYAAYIKALHLNDIDYVPLAQLKDFLADLFALKFPIENNFLQIHSISIDCAERDLISPKAATTATAVVARGGESNGKALKTRPASSRL